MGNSMEAPQKKKLARTTTGSGKSTTVYLFKGYDVSMLKGKLLSPAYVVHSS